ncbi:flagellar basal body-associated FliL family protein [Thiolapillus brandeum]|uniref:Flagellar protein FliL n=1 Tax=Thiolapillus brandeum TaxID=1076588 RepID=A0A7U6GIJ8_9GAMM|nr:flagellar basal body-associated FliL family protein [Thiolapillus brandeum]BAO44313.1 flagellar FliL protein [Thiolapillus brandeum]
MAKKEDLDLDVEGKGKKSSKSKLIVILLVGILVLGGGGGAAWYFLVMKGDASAQDVDADMEDVEQPVVRKKKRRKSNEPPLFTGLDPAFVVSFKDQSHARFMQLSVELMSRDPEVIEAVDQYKPMLRNNLLLLFSSQKYEDVITREGKEKLLEQSLEEVNRTLADEAGMDGVEAVYFTAFVAQ